MSDPVICWNCRNVTQLDTVECPVCFAGLDPAARGLSAEMAHAEQNALRPVDDDPIRSVVQPLSMRGYRTIVLLVIGAVFTALVFGFVVGHWVDARSCLDCDEDHTGILAGFNAFLIGIPVFSALFLSLAFWSRKRRLAELDASQVGRSRELP